jgi:predicted RNA-binding protein associated with RNAse of E/G family
MNPRKEPFKPGQTVVVREIWNGKLWNVRPSIMVRDDAELIVLYLPNNTPCKRHYGPHGDRITAEERKNDNWTLRDIISESSLHYIRLTIPGESYSILLFWDTSDNSLRCWYINLEDPANRIHRTTKGFDYTDHILDVIIEPNLKDWRWDDEDELSEVVELGLISPEKAKALYAKGEEVRDLLMSGKSIFNGWNHWKPDPSWQVPVLPDGWDIV